MERINSKITGWKIDKNYTEPNMIDSDYVSYTTTSEDQYEEAMLSIVKPESGVPKRPLVLSGFTYSLDIPHYSHKVYITINYEENSLGQRIIRELFIVSQDPDANDLGSALGVSTTATLRSMDNPEYILESLESIRSTSGGFWFLNQYMQSIPYACAKLMRDIIKYNKKTDTIKSNASISLINNKKSLVNEVVKKGKVDHCQSCLSINITRTEGCLKCLDCGYSKCG